MTLNVNTVTLGGTLTNDPQVRFFSNDKAVASFDIAMNKKYTSQGESKEETTFVSVECWGKTAENVGKFLLKGRQCIVEGELKLSRWTDKQDNKRSKILVTAHRVHFLGGAQSKSPAQGDQDIATGYSNSASESLGSDDGDPPF